MHRFIYKFSVFASAFAGALSLMNGTSIVTALFRAGVVFLGTLAVFVLALHVLRWAIVATTVVEALDELDGEEDKDITVKIEPLNEKKDETATQNPQLTAGKT